MDSLIQEQRRIYHHNIISKGVLTIDAKGVASNADSSSRISKAIAKSIAEQLGATSQGKILGQTSGSIFEEVNMAFIKDTFPKLQNLRPGKWVIEKLGNRNAVKTYSFAQYEHLEYLGALTQNDANLATALGNDYMVAPDIVVYRIPESDEEINAYIKIVDDECAKNSMIRSKYSSKPILHASISAKWTMRSDRAQNSRTEALGLIRNRKGPLPHISVVTAEPLPARLASLALGTGDIDCLYHFALYELKNAVEASGAEDALELLNILIDGKRLKDISDLPMDLSV